jgi:hypothetical protein
VGIVGVGESLSNWLLWTWGRVWQNRYCWRGLELDKLVFVGVRGSLKNWLSWACGEFEKQVILGVMESLKNWFL